MSLTLALNTALSSLNVNQRTMAVISHNIANANTEGYSRQVVDLASITIDGTGQGVRVEDVIRKVDEYLQAAINRQTSDVGRADVISEFMDRMQIFMGEPGSANSIDEHIETFFNSLQSMAETPERTSTRAAVVAAAVTLSNEFSSLAMNMQQLRLRADEEISQAVTTVNADLRKLYDINEALITADAFGNSKASLLDDRDAALKDIAKYLDIRTYEKDNGSVHVYVGSGISLLDDVPYQLSYTKLGNVEQLIDDANYSPITLNRVDPETYATIGSPITIATGGTSDEVTPIFSSGEIFGLMQIRDKLIPEMLQQIDTLAATLRDKVNEIHNQGSGYPAATELTGTRLVNASDASAWEGSVRIAVLDKEGRPVTAAYTDEAGGFRPLLLNLSQLYNGTSTLGEPDVQSIIDEINNHFTVPQSKLELGNLNQIQLSMLSDNVPGATPVVNFDFDIENISGQYGDFWINDVQVLDDTATNITNVSNTLPSITLDPAATYTTTFGSTDVVVTSLGAHNLKVGDRVHLTDPGGPVDGIAGATFDDYFTVTAVSGNTFTVDLGVLPAVGMTTGIVGQSAYPPYDTITAGEQDRTFQNGSISANLSLNPSSTYYDFQVTMAVRAEDGTVSTSVVNYRVESPLKNTRNDRFSANAVISGSATVVPSSNTQGYLRAMLVDADGNELNKTNGEYGDQAGYLKIVTRNPEYTVVIDELGSSQLGLPSNIPPEKGTGRGFSWYFELNNFFKSNDPTPTGDTLKNSALYMAVEDRLQDNPSLLSTGNLQLSNQPSSSYADPLYTYERYSGDNSIAQKLAKLGIEAIDFSAAGGLPDMSLSFNGYAGEMLGYMTSQTVAASSTLDNAQILLSGYNERSDAISGVNLDEELANMIIYQNAYTASARVIKVTDELFDTLLQMT